MNDRTTRLILGLFGGALAAVVATLSLSVPSDAITSPTSGAVAKPGDFELHWPFADGERVLVTSGYGSGMGSTLHRNTDVTGSANDHYALDLVLPDHPNNGFGQPVLAMASGTIVKAGWATAGWANYGQRVILRHDYNADGHTYITHYAHLDTIAVSEGQHIDQGQQLGTLGDSCEGDQQNRACPFFGAHLHVAMHRDSSVGGSGTGGTYGGNAVVMEPIDGAEDIVQGNTVISRNGGDPPGPCQTVEGPETILEDNGPCMHRFGPPQFWHEESAGHGGQSFWTFTLDTPQPDNFVRWDLHFAEPGDFDLWAYVPGLYGQSQQARYVVRHDGRQDTAVRDQRQSPDVWLSLGRFRFAEGGDQWVMLEDNTGEPYIDANNNTQIAFDALRLRPVSDPDPEPDPQPEPQPDPMPDPQPTMDAGGNDVPDPTPDADPTPEVDPTTDTGMLDEGDAPEPDGLVDTANPDPAPAPRPSAVVKEGCATTPGGAAAGWWVILAGLALLTRR